MGKNRNTENRKQKNRETHRKTWENIGKQGTQENMGKDGKT